MIPILETFLLLNMIDFLDEWVSLTLNQLAKGWKLLCAFTLLVFVYCGHVLHWKL